MRTLLIAVLIGLHCFPAHAGSQVYIVKAGDTMSSIAADEMPGEDSIYRKNGRLSALLKANPKINPANRVYVGAVIVLPDLNEIDLRQPASVGSDAAPQVANSPAKSASNEAPPPLVAATPVTVTVPVSAPAPETYSPRLNFGLGGSFVDLRSQDRGSGARANFASDFIPSVQISLAQPLSDFWSVYGRAEYRDMKFQQPVSGGTVQQPGSQKGISAGVLCESKGVRLGLEAGLRQSPFPRALGANIYAFDRLTVPYTRALIAVEPIHIGAAKLGLEGRYDYLGESNSGPQRAGAGKALAGEVYWGYKFKNRREYRLGITYSKSEQSTNLSNQEQTAIGLGFNLIWPLGD